MAFRKKGSGGGKGGYNHGPALAPKPAGFDEAVKALRAQLPGVNVGFGFGNGAGLAAVNANAASDGTASAGRWQLYVYTDDASLVVPTEFKGFPVFRRAVPAALKPKLQRARLS